MSDEENKLLECPKCGWVHFGVSQDYIDQWEKDWAISFEKMTPEQRGYYGLTDYPPTQTDGQYLKCFNCGNKNIDSFRSPTKELRGSTIQPVLNRKLGQTR